MGAVCGRAETAQPRRSAIATSRPVAGWSSADHSHNAAVTAVTAVACCHSVWLATGHIPVPSANPIATRAAARVSANRRASRNAKTPAIAATDAAVNWATVPGALAASSCSAPPARSVRRHGRSLQHRRQRVRIPPVPLAIPHEGLALAIQLLASDNAVEREDVMAREHDGGEFGGLAVGAGDFAAVGDEREPEERPRPAATHRPPRPREGEGLATG